MSATAPPAPPAARTPPDGVARTPLGPVTVSVDLPAPSAALAQGPRLVAFAALAVFCGLQWAALVRPSSPGRLLVMVAIAIVSGLLAYAAGALSRWWRVGAVLAVAVMALALATLASGVPLHLLAPKAWGSLGAGINQGIVALPGITVPYRGVDPWVRIVVLAGGGALLLLAALLAARSARARTAPNASAIVLTVAYVIAVIEHTPGEPFLGGAVFTVLLVAFLRADRLERRRAPAALAFACVAALSGLIVGPHLDGSRPWLHYEQIAEALSTPPTTTFDWNQSYGPLHWSRDGREVLRVKASTPAYWKAADLDTFDGLRWKIGGVRSSGLDSEIARGHPAWKEQISVQVRNLRSSEYLGAGVAFGVRGSPRPVLSSSPGTFVTGENTLRRGDSYVASVYTPEATVDTLEGAGTRYPPFADDYLTMDLPASVGGPRIPAASGASEPVAQLRFPEYGDTGTPRVSAPGGPAGYGTQQDGTVLLNGSAYAQVYALAQQLRAKSGTPYDFALAIENYLSRGFSYTETPPVRAITIPAFLFRDKVGYCQQFSGAMALLLRMGGVPARVSSGFATGTFDSQSDEWVVRDVDAHAWVEAYFPGTGWITLDPTPQAAPPRGQIVNAAPTAPSGGVAPAGATTTDAGGAPAPRDPEPAAPAGASASSTAAAAATHGFPVALVAVIVVLAVLLAAGAVLALRRARRTPAGVAPELAELERALRWTGHSAAAPLTLIALEERFARHRPEAAAYVAAIRATRYSEQPERPSEGQRAALRRELAEGRSPFGRLRARLALPPRRFLQ